MKLHRTDLLAIWAMFLGSTLTLAIVAQSVLDVVLGGFVLALIVLAFYKSIKQKIKK